MDHRPRVSSSSSRGPSSACCWPAGTSGGTQADRKPMDEFVAALADQQAELRALLDDMAPSDWQRPSRCAGWTTADVVLHVAQTNEMAIASAEGRFAEFLTEMGRDLGPASDVDDGADRMVEKERGL